MDEAPVFYPFEKTFNEIPQKMFSKFVSFMVEKSKRLIDE
jgi:hypothetical protein